MRTPCPISYPAHDAVMVTHLKQFCGTQQGAVELATTGAFLFMRRIRGLDQGRKAPCLRRNEQVMLREPQPIEKSYIRTNFRDKYPTNLSQITHSTCDKTLPLNHKWRGLKSTES